MFYNCMQVYPDILACKYIRVHFLRFQNTKYPLTLACNTKRGNWVEEKSIWDENDKKENLRPIRDLIRWNSRKPFTLRIGFCPSPW